MAEQSARIDDGSGNIIVQAVDSTVRIGAPATLKLYPWHRRPRRAKSDVALLDPFTLSVPFVGRAAELERLEAWLRSPAPIAARCLTGRTGSGKTRLAIELCARAEAQAGGWDAGFLSHPELQRFFDRENISTWGWRRPTLIVLDYAAGAGRALKPWLEELSRNSGQPERPLRLLLLERFADEGAGWWAELMRTGWSDAGIPELFDPPIPEPLDPIAPADRAALRSAIADVASPLSSRHPRARPGGPWIAGTNPAMTNEGDVEAPEALDVLMAGLAEVKGIGPAGGRPVGRIEMAQVLAGHERRRLDAIASDRALEAAALAHVAAVLTLQGGVAADAALEMVEAEVDALRSRADPRALYTALRDAYAPPDGERLPPILPDLIGEAFVLDAFARAPLSLKQQGQTVARARARSEEATIASVMRTAQDFAEAETHPALRWVDALVEGCVEPEALIRLADAFPQQTLALRERAASITAAIAGHLREVTADPDYTAIPSQRAAILNNLSNRLSALGRREEALKAIEEAVSIDRELAAVRPDAFRSDLAGSLNNLSLRLSDLGRREEALSAIEEAVAIRRDLAAARPDAFRPDLAGSLNNLSNRLSDLGRREEALAAIAEAVGVYRDLAASRPDAFLADLARSLAVQANCLEAMDDLDAALRCDRESVALLMQHFVRWPEAFVDLMRTICQGYLGHCEAAGAEPDEALLRPVIEMFERMQGTTTMRQ